MRVLLCLALMVAKASAMEAVVECSYDWTGGHSVFVQPAAEASAWLKRIGEDHSMPGWDAKEECHALDNQVPNWHLFVQTYNGQVSLQHALTHDQCERLLYSLHPMHSTGVRMVQPSDFQRGECFQ
jgi:hypothetical protein